MNKRIIASVVAAVFVAAVLIGSGPRGIATESRRTGTLDLTSHAERGHHQLAAFVLTDGTPEFGGLGADEHTEVEIGSVTKMFTVEITQQLIEEGALSRDTRIGEVLDLGDSPRRRHHCQGTRHPHLRPSASRQPRLLSQSRHNGHKRKSLCG